MKTMAMIVAVALMVAAAPVANASINNEHVAETGTCVLSYGEDDVDALAIAEAVNKNLDAEDYSAAVLLADYEAEAQRLRDELAAGGGVVTVSREDMALEDQWMWADALAEHVDFYVVEHALAYGLGSSDVASIDGAGGSGLSSVAGSSMTFGVDAVIPVSALQVATQTRDAQAMGGQACVDGESTEVKTPDASQAVADIQRQANGGGASSSRLGVVLGILGVLGALSAVAAVGFGWLAAFGS